MTLNARLYPKEPLCKFLSLKRTSDHSELRSITDSGPVTYAASGFSSPVRNDVYNAFRLPSDVHAAGSAALLFRILDSKSRRHWRK